MSALLLLLLHVAAAYADSTYSFGVVPQFDTRHLQSVWQPILQTLERETGLQFKLRGSPTIPRFEKELMEGHFDFAYMNPYHALLASEANGYRPLLRDNGKTLYGILVVRKDDPIKEPGELAGRRVAFPAPNALGASLQIRADFADKFGIEVEPRYVKTHSSVYLNVILGETAAGGGVQKTLARQSPEIRGQLRVLHSSQKVSPHPITAHPRVPLEIQERVRKGFLAIGATEEGRALLAKVPIQRIGEASIDDYTPLRTLRLERFYVAEE
ncbi:MAG: phosphate/phosphite/phosphonate ABC transporter substrate-binding protein [Gammaproteobacteria bacterium]|nr:phosphate/phosphite/phosphonate ABC transporter substrate-binding protein [Gammaproteobacteria bacterium]